MEDMNDKTPDEGVQNTNPEVRDADVRAEKDAGAMWKIAVVLLLAAAAVFVVFTKGRGARGGRKGCGTACTLAESSSTQAAPDAGDAAIATVNGEAITAAELDAVLAALPEEVRKTYQFSKADLLDDLVTRLILLQEARRAEIEKTETYRRIVEQAGEKAVDAQALLISAFVEDRVFAAVTATDEEVRCFYDENKARLPAETTFDQIKDRLKDLVARQKKLQALDEYIAGLKKKAKIVISPMWLDQQKTAAADNPLGKALASGKPVLVDFGRDMCMPCKMMAPILDKLAVELKDKVHVIVINTGERRDLARRYEIKVVPTQIFFDASGKEVFRHEGFFAKEDILAKWKELGIRLEANSDSELPKEDMKNSHSGE